MKKEVKADSLAIYIDRITRLKPNETENSLYSEELVFRGLSSRSYYLVPSIGRRPSRKWANSMLTTERDLVSEAQTKFPDIFQNDDLPINKLAKLQHYGIPTRLLDVTTSALVALFFACRKCSDSNLSQDGEVVVFSMRSLPALNSYANIIADTYRLIGDVRTPVERYYYKAIQQSYSISLKDPEWEQLDELRIHSFMQNFTSPLLVEAFESSLRQKNQQGKYILFPNTTSKVLDKDYIIDELVTLEKNDKSIIKRIIIPEGSKDKILQQLQLLGVKEEFLFADNIDTVFRNVKEHQEQRFS